MSVNASPDRVRTALDELLLRAGAITTQRNGVPLVANYGSAASELAACVGAVGIAVRPDLAQLELTASAATLGALMARAAGGPVAPGGARYAGGVWWCGVPAAPGQGEHRPGPARAERVIVLGQPSTARRLASLQLDGHTMQQSDLRLHDRSEDWTAIAILGRRADQVLGALGVYGPAGDPRGASPFTNQRIGAPAQWLLESDRQALALVPRGDAGAAWRAIERVGREFGMCCVGEEARRHYALLEHRSEPSPPG